MATVVRIGLEEGAPTSTATAFIGDVALCWAREVRAERAVRECMKLAKQLRPGEELRFALPFCGKRFHVPWWEKRERIPLRDQARLRSRGTPPGAT